MEFESVLRFWFVEIEPSQWWRKDADFDRLIARRFGELHARAARCELYRWREHADGALAEVIVLDQFSRNIYRDQPASFAQDPLALGLAQAAVARGQDQQLEQSRRAFLYMPYMHSESLPIHDVAVALYTALDDPSSLGFEHKHRAIIQRFGRYPHRNAILGRTSTPAEESFLSEPGSSF